MLADAPDDAKMLLVYFAEPDEKIDLRTKQDTEELEKNKGQRVLCIRVASKTAFEEDCRWADIIYLHGGKTAKLMGILSEYPDIKGIFSGKTVAADSAGAHALGALFYSKNSKTVGSGLGILPLKIMAHYEDGAPDPLGDTRPELPSLLLREYETKTIMIQSTHAGASIMSSP